MGNPNSGIARGELRSTLSRAGSCRSSGTTSMKADGGKNPRFAPVTNNVKNDVSKKPRFAHVMDNMKNDGGRKAGSAHVNQTTGAKTPQFAPVTKPLDPFLA